MTTSARNSGVAARTIRPVALSSTFTKNFSLCNSLVTRICVDIQRTTGFFEMSGAWSVTHSIRMPVAIRKAAKI